MPNWVFCTVSIVGKPDLVEQVKEMLAQPYDTYHRTYVDGKFENVKDVHKSVFSFWNIVSPSDTHAYFYGETPRTNLENFAESFTKNEAEGTDWYFWNLREWGCKWDACEAYIEDDNFYPADKEGEKSVYYKFETPWSPPLPAIEKLAAMYPELTIALGYEEEQGWGGEITWVNGDVVHDETWDIPNSHEEEMERRDTCWACESLWYDKSKDEWDFTGMYNDCPRPTDEELDELQKQQEVNRKWMLEQIYLTNPSDSDTIAQEVV